MLCRVMPLLLKTYYFDVLYDISPRTCAASVVVDDSGVNYFVLFNLLMYKSVLFSLLPTLILYCEV